MLWEVEIRRYMGMRAVAVAVAVAVAASAHGILRNLLGHLYRMLAHLVIVAAVSVSVSSGQYLSGSCTGELVKTHQGDICGVERTTTLGGPEDPKFSYIAFQGIPFAQPPLGKLRFKNPIAGPPWEGIRDGNWSIPFCPQVNFTTYFSGDPDIFGQEDCLYLNVFIPKEAYRGSGYFSDMIFILNDTYQPPVANHHRHKTCIFYWLTLTNDIQAVFVYTVPRMPITVSATHVAVCDWLRNDLSGDLNGILKIIADFCWGHQVVKLYGINLDSIIIHLTHLNKRRESYTCTLSRPENILSLSFLWEEHIKNFLTQYFNCLDMESSINHDSREVVTCLQAITRRLSVFGFSTFTKFNHVPQRIGFRIEPDTIPDHPAKLLKDGKYHMVDLIAGTNSHEGALWAKFWYNTPELFDDLAQNFSDNGHWALNLLPSENHVARELYNYYLGGVRTYTEEDADALVQLTGDLFFAIPNDVIIQLHTRDSLYGRNIFAYDFQHRGQSTFLQDLAPHLGQDWVNHADELQYLFSCEWFQPLEKKEDLQMRKIMLDLWSNFAKYGNPTPDRSLGFTWQPVGLETQPHLALKLHSHMEADKRAQVRSFFHTLDLPMNRILYPGQIAAGKDWHPWRATQEKQSKCNA
ncbi:unnamed protein product, partial [Meganyctiphanes norvegica]